MRRLLVICGPTATGKTALGIRLAKKFGGEIVSADSRQVYKGMDVGTGKDLPVNPKFEIRNSKQTKNSKLKIQNYKIGSYLINGVRVWLYDVIEPDYQFSAADYVRCANLVIKDMWRRGKLPILVGGTGFYIKAVIDGIETIGIKPDWELRKRLSGYRVIRLSGLLRKLDPEKWERMNESDRKNPRRLIRAIEIAMEVQRSKRKVQNRNLKLKTQDVLMIGLMAPYKILYKRIDRRVEERIKRGIVEEIKDLLRQGYSWENSVLGETIGYKEWRGCFGGSRFKVQDSREKEEVIQRWKYNEHGYARRQMSWFKKEKRIHWLDITKEGFEKEVEGLVAKWLLRRPNAIDEGKNL